MDYRPTAPEGQWTAQCPSHDDRTASLHITEKDDGRLLIHCFVGCKGEDVLAALGLEWVDLIPETMKKRKWCSDCRRGVDESWAYCPNCGKRI